MYHATAFLICLVISVSAIAFPEDDDQEIFVFGSGGSTELREIPLTVIDKLGTVPASSLSIVELHAAMLFEDGSAICWGFNGDGQCDIPEGVGTPENPIQQLIAGLDHTVALLENGSVQCWGSDVYGQCQIPGPVLEPKVEIVSIAAGHSYSAALASDGRLFVWGETNFLSFPPDESGAFLVFETGSDDPESGLGISLGSGARILFVEKELGVVKGYGDGPLWTS